MLKRLKEKYFQQGFDEGVETGKQIGYQTGYSEALRFAEEYYEGNTQDKDIIIHKAKEKTDIELYRELESFLTWVKSVTQISDSDYFVSYLFEGYTVEQLENMLKYIDYLSLQREIQELYPETHGCLYELYIALREVVENKIMLNEVEKIIR